MPNFGEAWERWLVSVQIPDIVVGDLRQQKEDVDIETPYGFLTYPLRTRRAAVCALVVPIYLLELQ